jgi:hypothetical protein
MIKSQRLLLRTICVILLLTGCNRGQKFTAEGWDMGDGLTFTARNNMVDDLLQTHHFEGMKYLQVRHLLRYPQYRDSTQFYYTIIETYNNMQKPDHIKKLIFYMRKDSVITKVELYDNKADVKSKFY